MKYKWSGVAAIVLAGASVSAQAQEWTGNVGFDSEYVFRGIPQSDSSVNGGADFESGIGDTNFGYYIGTWAADVEDGLEIDYYGGVTASVGDVGFLVGYTYYDYTDDFDDTYQEFNFGIDWSFLSLAAAIGEYDNFAGPTQDYDYYELTLSNNGFFATVGTFRDDFDGEFVQVGYGTAIAGVDVTASYIYSNGDLLGGSSDSTLIVQASKGFSWDDLTSAWKGITN